MDGNVRDLLDVVKKEKVNFRPHNHVSVILLLFVSVHKQQLLSGNKLNLRDNWESSVHFYISFRVIEREM